MEVSLDKDIYFHGDTVRVFVSIRNNSEKFVRSIKVSIVQNTEVTMADISYSKIVVSTDSQEGCPINPGASFAKTFQLQPTAQNNLEKRGIALDGILRETSSNLASSTHYNPQEAVGILISYVARVKLTIGPMAGDIQDDVPFRLVNLEVVSLICDFLNWTNA